MNVQSLLMCGLLYVGSYSLVMALAYTFEFRLAPAIVAVLIPLAALFADYKAWSKNSPESKPKQWLTLKNAVPGGVALAMALLLPFNLSLIL